MYPIFISMTTTLNRLYLCRIALTSIALQSLTPNRIIINLSKDPYLRDDGINLDDEILLSLLDGVPRQLQHIVEIRWVSNTGPYRKLIPTLKKADYNDIIITADDDIFYNKKWLESLLQNFDPEQKTIHAARVLRKRKNLLGYETGYTHWKIIEKATVLRNSDWIITYGGGAVMCRSWFNNELINDDTYLQIAPTADDLWYSKLAQLSNLNVKVIPEALGSLVFLQHKDGLVNDNLPLKNKLIQKGKYFLLDYHLNHFKLRKFGNDTAYEAIERYFQTYNNQENQ